MAARFTDRLTAPVPGFRDVLRILREGGFKGRNHHERDAASVPRVSRPLPRLRAGEASLTWIGHATYLLRLAGLSILTDPIFAKRLPNFTPRLVPPGVAWEDLPPIDAVVISHNHYDHLDAATVRRLPRDTAIFAPLGVRRFFARRGFLNIHELDWWQTATHGDVAFTFVPGHHWSGRVGWDNNRSLWGGWVIEGGGRRLYFGGDTAFGKRFAEVGARFDGFDAAMMPIGAYAPRWFMKAVHVDPDEAVQATRDLGARRLAAMHWGTFVLTQEPLMEPLEKVRNAWASAGLAREDLWDLAIGETRILP